LAKYRLAGSHITLANPATGGKIEIRMVGRLLTIQFFRTKLARGLWGEKRKIRDNYATYKYGLDEFTYSEEDIKNLEFFKDIDDILADKFKDALKKLVIDEL